MLHKCFMRVTKSYLNSKLCFSILGARKWEKSSYHPSKVNDLLMTWDLTNAREYFSTPWPKDPWKRASYCHTWSVLVWIIEDALTLRWTENGENGQGGRCKITVVMDISGRDYNCDSMNNLFHRFSTMFSSYIFTHSIRFYFIKTFQ